MERRTLGSEVEMSDAGSSRVVPTWPMGMQTRLTSPQYRRRELTKGMYFSVFSLSFLWQPKSLLQPISKKIKKQSLRLKELMSGDGSAGERQSERSKDCVCVCACLRVCVCHSSLDLVAAPQTSRNYHSSKP